MASHQDKELITFRCLPVDRDAVRQIAEREGESLSTVIRRLLRRGLDVERRAVQVGQ